VVDALEVPHDQTQPPPFVALAVAGMLAPPVLRIRQALATDLGGMELTVLSDGTLTLPLCRTAMSRC
jgi:hypothetical protein